MVEDAAQRRNDHPSFDMLKILFSIIAEIIVCLHRPIRDVSIGHAEAGERSGHNRYSYTLLGLPNIASGAF